MKTTLILMRHGESVWNKLNLFTGWVDIPLSKEGIQESIAGGKKIENCPIDVVFTSALIRAQMTVVLALLQHTSGKVPLFLPDGEEKVDGWAKIYSEEALKTVIPVYRAWELNERMYGKLQGFNKDATIKQFGAEQVEAWRRSFSASPPDGESLKMTVKRVIPYVQKKIIPRLEKRENVFIAAHGNSLRGIVMYLDSLSEEEVAHLELRTGEPLLYFYNGGKWGKE